MNDQKIISVADEPNIRLLADRVLVKVMTPDEVKTASGIIVSTGASDESTLQGMVLRVSSRVVDESKKGEEVSRGDVLMFSSFSDSLIKYKGKEFKVLRITDIFGVLEPETDDKQ